MLLLKMPNDQEQKHVRSAMRRTVALALVAWSGLLLLAYVYVSTTLECGPTSTATPTGRTTSSDAYLCAFPSAQSMSGVAIVILALWVIGIVIGAAGLAIWRGTKRS